jgi:hypothetical protein
VNSVNSGVFEFFAILELKRENEKTRKHNLNIQHTFVCLLKDYLFMKLLIKKRQVWKYSLEEVIT